MRKELIFALVLICSSLVLAACPGNLVSYWTFDSYSTPYVDTVGSNHCSCSGSECPVWTSPSQVGAALDYDGVDDYLDCGNDSSLGFTSSMSLEAWIYPEACDSSTLNYIASNIGGFPYDGYAFALRNVSGGCKLAFAPGWVYSTSDITLNAWNHVVVAFDGSDAYFFIDGNSAGSVSTSAPLSSSDPFLIGRDPFLGGGEDSEFEGLIDEVAAYTGALNASEVNQHYQYGLNNNGYCEEEGIIPEVKGGRTFKIFMILIIALLIGSALIKRN